MVTLALALARPLLLTTTWTGPVVASTGVSTLICLVLI